jgi:hypothetical protein
MSSNRQGGDFQVGEEELFDNQILGEEDEEGLEEVAGGDEELELDSGLLQQYEHVMNFG